MALHSDWLKYLACKYFFSAEQVLLIWVHNVTDLRVVSVLIIRSSDI
jgi:hypothetical protein